MNNSYASEEEYLDDFEDNAYESPFKPQVSPAKTKVSFTQLQHENLSLTTQLKEINKKLTELLQQKPKAEPQTNLQLVQQEKAKNLDRQLAFYKTKVAKMRQRVQQLTDITYLPGLAQELHSKQQTLKNLEAERFQLKKAQQNRSKDLVRYCYDGELTDDGKAIAQSLDEFNSLQHAIEKTQAKIDKNKEMVQAMCEREKEWGGIMRKLKTHTENTPLSPNHTEKQTQFQELIHGIENSYRQREAMKSQFKVTDRANHKTLEKLELDITQAEQELKEKEGMLENLAKEMNRYKAAKKPRMSFVYASSAHRHGNHAKSLSASFRINRNNGQKYLN